MSDTQWPRYEVFKQDRPDQPHRNVGSVHAPDAEVAWLNARDVFARRPACHSLWVVPEEAISALSPASEPAPRITYQPVGFDSLYALFAKQTQRQSMTYVDFVGEIAAPSAGAALLLVTEAFPDVAAVVWWACPVEAITRSLPNESADLLGPSQTKLFRLPNQYHTVFTMQKIKRGDEGDT